MDEVFKGAVPAGELDPTTVPIVITLVHGTWAAKAPWIKSRSKLVMALRARLPAGSKIFPFVWTGKNTNTARRRASDRLLKKLDCRLDRYPRARHYVIGHSHGGNVILRTLASAPFRDRIAGVVCLSTPFLVARARDLGKDPWKHIIGAVIGPILLATWIGVRAPSATGWMELLKFTALVLLLSLAAGIAATVLRRWRLYSDELLKDLQSPVFDADKTLIIRSPGDEASGGLDFLQLITRMTVGLWVRTMSLYERLEAAAKRAVHRRMKMAGMAAAVAFLYFGFITAMIFLNRMNSPLGYAGIIVLAWALLEASFLALGWAEGAAFPFLVLAAAVMWPITIMLSVLLLGFGWEVALANILLDVTAETTPTGSWRVHLLDPPTSADLGQDVVPLMHSVVYENPQVFRLVGDWIANAGVTAPQPPTFFEPR